MEPDVAVTGYNADRDTLSVGTRQATQQVRAASGSTNWLLLSGAGLLIVVLGSLSFLLLRGDSKPPPPTSATATPGPVSPEGRISFLRDNAGARDLYVIDPDGSRQERVTSNILFEGSTAWSPDGTHIIAQIGQEGVSTIARLAIGHDNKATE